MVTTPFRLKVDICKFALFWIEAAETYVYPLLSYKEKNYS